jgi:hypothetical protein
LGSIPGFIAEEEAEAEDGDQKMPSPSLIFRWWKGDEIFKGKFSNGCTPES